MKTIPPLLLADLQSSTTSIALLWTITQSNGVVIRGTEHDLDIVLPPPDPNAGTYFASANVTATDVVSSSDLAVDNLEVTGAVPAVPSTVIPDISIDAIEGGMLDMAPVCVIVCNWQAPEHGSFVVKSGFLGQITRDSDGKYTTEVRGLTQLLAQNFMLAYTPTCTVVEFGDAQCKYPVANITKTGTVTSGTSPQTFGVTLSAGADYSYVYGKITFTSGANTGFSRMVKVDPIQNAGIIVLYEALPEPVAAGDAFKLAPGCDRKKPTCIAFGNVTNFRGYGVYVPGIDAILAGPAQTAEL